MLLDRICIIFLGISIIFQQLQIMELRKTVYSLDRHRKFNLRSFEIQNKINEMFCMLIKTIDTK